MENKIKNMFLTLMESIVRAAQHLESVTKTLRCLRFFFSCGLFIFLNAGTWEPFALQQFIAWRKHSRCLMHQRSYSKQFCRVLSVEREKKSNLLQDLSLSVSRILASRLNDIYSLIIYKS